MKQKMKIGFKKTFYLTSMLLFVSFIGLFIGFHDDVQINRHDNIMLEVQQHATERKADVLPQLKKREDFSELLERLDYKTAIEIGVRNGIFAEKLLKRWPSFETYYGIDPYAVRKVVNESIEIEFQDELYESVKEKIKEIGGPRAHLIRNSSLSVVKKFIDNSIDFIYLNGLHDFCTVSAELEAYYPKLRCYGIMAGYSYLNAGQMIGFDWRMCENGQIVLIKGGAVKGNTISISKFENKLFENLRSCT